MFYTCKQLDERASAVHDYLQMEIASASQGAFRLDSFEKTNGYEQNLMGMNYYVIEWQGVVSVQMECWQDGGTLERFSVLKQVKQSPYQSNLLIHYPQGATIHYVGDCQLLKTENGWRVENTHVKKRSILSFREYVHQGKIYFDKALSGGVNEKEVQDLEHVEILARGIKKGISPYLLGV